MESDAFRNVLFGFMTNDVSIWIGTLMLILVVFIGVAFKEYLSRPLRTPSSASRPGLHQSFSPFLFISPILQSLQLHVPDHAFSMVLLVWIGHDHPFSICPLGASSSSHHFPVAVEKEGGAFLFMIDMVTEGSRSWHGIYSFSHSILRVMETLHARASGKLNW